MLGFTVVMGGPDELEGYLFPMTSPTKAEMTKDDGKEICWKISFTRYREGVPLFFAWILTDTTGKKHYLPNYRPKTDNEGWNQSNTSKPGEEPVFDNCARKPSGVSDRYTLRAVARYEVPWRLWTIPRYIGPF